MPAWNFYADDSAGTVFESGGDGQMTTLTTSSDAQEVARSTRRRADGEARTLRAETYFR
jgi:hypothetical protein